MSWRMTKLRIKILLTGNVSFSSHASSMSIRQEQGIEEKNNAPFSKIQVCTEFLLKKDMG